MPYVLVFTEQYTRRATRFLKRHPQLHQQYLKTLQLLEINPLLNIYTKSIQKRTNLALIYSHRQRKSHDETMVSLCSGVHLRSGCKRVQTMSFDTKMKFYNLELGFRSTV